MQTPRFPIKLPSHFTQLQTLAQLFIERSRMAVKGRTVGSGVSLSSYKPSRDSQLSFITPSASVFLFIK